MTTPRAEQIDLSMTTYYHCISRCVRGSYLCGEDYKTGKDYTHRKAWVVHLIKELVQGFAIQVASYAVMTNHYHLVLHVDSQRAKNWTQEDIKRQWGLIFPKSLKALNEKIKIGLDKRIIESEIEEWHARLTDISWFMRCLNERLARWANQEEGCKGRFWEGRFKCQALLDQSAILSAMAYVDLNPIRAKLAETPETSEYTSVKERIELLSECKTEANTPEGLMAFYNQVNNDHTGGEFIECKLPDYLELVDASGKMVREGKRGVIPNNLPSILNRLDIEFDDWIDMVQNLESSFAHAVGSGGMLKYCGFRRKTGPGHNPFERFPPTT